MFLIPIVQRLVSYINPCLSFFNLPSIATLRFIQANSTIAFCHVFAPCGYFHYLDCICHVSPLLSLVVLTPYSPTHYMQGLGYVKVKLSQLTLHYFSYKLFAALLDSFDERTVNVVPSLRQIFNTNGVEGALEFVV